MHDTMTTIKELLQWLTTTKKKPQKTKQKQQQKSQYKQTDLMPWIFQVRNNFIFQVEVAEYSKQSKKVVIAS